ncbi:hypothetical protein P692DRAFT_20347792 [Suillus brevipes Sb2]|nr:hypothetical protein P692DRAFT_20347792 [Suillus brevipes Sb2]
MIRFEPFRVYYQRKASIELICKTNHRSHLYHTNMPAAQRMYFCSCYRKCGGTPTSVTRSVYRSHSRDRLEMDGLPSNIPAHQLVDDNSCTNELDSDLEEETISRDEEFQSQELRVEGELLGNVFDGHVGYIFHIGNCCLPFIRMTTLIFSLHPSNKTSRDSLRAEMVPVQLSRMSQMQMIPSMSHLPLMLMKRFLKCRPTVSTFVLASLFSLFPFLTACSRSIRLPTAPCSRFTRCIMFCLARHIHSLHHALVCCHCTRFVTFVVKNTLFSLYMVLHS